MEKKYYELIVSLVKNHRKFLGYESILNDIVEDVYSHSKVIINSITNEEVLLTYLAKVVDTSIITVPKKLNLNTRIRHRSITNEPIVQPAVLEVKEQIEMPQPQPEEEPEEELLLLDSEEEKQTAEELIIEDTETSEKLIEHLETEDEIAEELELATELLKEEEDDDDVVNIEPETSSEEADVLELENEIVIEEPKSVNMTLVDNMINGLSETTSKSENATKEDSEIIDSSEIELTLAEEDDEEITDLDNELEEFTEIEPLGSVTNEAEEDILSIDEAEPNLLEQEQTLESFDTLQEEDLNEEFNPPSFECFNYKPQIDAPNFSDEEIINELQNINSKHPEKQIIEICSLKYTDKLSVSEIAEKIGMDKETVLEVLDEIIDIVKD